MKMRKDIFEERVTRGTGRPLSRCAYASITSGMWEADSLNEARCVRRGAQIVGCAQASSIKNQRVCLISAKILRVSAINRDFL